MKSVLRILVVLTVITSVECQLKPDAQALKKIRIGYPSLSFRQSNVWVAREMGLFNKYGLEVEPIFLRGGQMATQALVAGDPPIVNIGTVVQGQSTGLQPGSGRRRRNEVRSDCFRPQRHQQARRPQGQEVRHQRLSARRLITLPISCSSTSTWRSTRTSPWFPPGRTRSGLGR